jgi:hypothetical protein
MAYAAWRGTASDVPTARTVLSRAFAAHDLVIGAVEALIRLSDAG